MNAITFKYKVVDDQSQATALLRHSVTLKGKFKQCHHNKPDHVA